MFVALICLNAVNLSLRLSRLVNQSGIIEYREIHNTTTDISVGYAKCLTLNLSETPNKPTIPKPKKAIRYS